MLKNVRMRRNFIVGVMIITSFSSSILVASNGNHAWNKYEQCGKYVAKLARHGESALTPTERDVTEKLIRDALLTCAGSSKQLLRSVNHNSYTKGDKTAHNA